MNKEVNAVFELFLGRNPSLRKKASRLSDMGRFLMHSIVERHLAVARHEHGKLLLSSMDDPGFLGEIERAAQTHPPLREVFADIGGLVEKYAAIAQRLRKNPEAEAADEEYFFSRLSLKKDGTTDIDPGKLREDMKAVVMDYVQSAGLFGSPFPQRTAGM